MATKSCRAKLKAQFTICQMRREDLSIPKIPNYMIYFRCQISWSEYICKRPKYLILNHRMPRKIEKLEIDFQSSNRNFFIIISWPCRLHGIETCRSEIFYYLQFCRNLAKKSGKSAERCYMTLMTSHFFRDRNLNILKQNFLIKVNMLKSISIFISKFRKKPLKRGPATSLFVTSHSSWILSSHRYSFYRQMFTNRRESVTVVTSWSTLWRIFIFAHYLKFICKMIEISLKKQFWMFF